MSRKKPKTRRTEVVSHSTVRSRRPMRQLAIVAGIVIALGAIATWIVSRPRPPLAISTEPFPAPRDTQVAVAAAAFVGSDACAGCHRAQADAWRSSTHARAGGPPGPVDVIAPFDGTPLRFADAEVVPRSSGSRFAFIVRQSGADDRVLSVDGVVGGAHMQGGGTQGFLTRAADGTWRFLPFDFSRQAATWFCNTIGKGNRGWVPISPALSITDCSDWPPSRIMGDEPRFSNCQSCHGSQVTVRLDTVARAYRTTMQSLGINCESCHGPGGVHVDRVRDAAAVGRGDIAMTSLATLGKDQSLGTCWQCHALKDQLRPGFTSGMDLADYYSIRLPQLGDAALHDDGRTRTFAYQEGHLSSECYRSGGMTCTSCHDPHSQSYRDVTGTVLVGRFDDRQCTSCHASKADSAISHTRHAADSPGSRCTACHMPYLQQPELGTAIPYRRSDHTISIPRPAVDSSSGIVGACQGCHSDRTVSSLASTVQSWYGELKPLPAAVDALKRARDGMPRGAAARLILRDDEQHTQALFAGMAWFLETQLGLDMVELERDVIQRLERLTSHADDDVAAIALASLHFARGTEPKTRQFLLARLDSLGARESRIRSRWGVVMGFLADRARSVGDGRTATTLYARALEADPTQTRTLVNQGLALADVGDHSAAITSYRAALARDPAQPLTLVNLGIALAARNDVPGAIAAYRRAIALNPREPLAYFNLGAVYAGQAQADSAVLNFLRAAELDPSIAIANFYASRLLLDLGNPREALRQIEAGLRFEPSASEARQMRDLIRGRLGGSR